jgi:murein DD-endopeptidase MepM/ murein hydrolase activator NlpD
MSNLSRFLLSSGIVLVIVAGYFLIRQPVNPGRNFRVIEWIRNPSAHSNWAVKPGERCGSAHFVMPTGGYIGFLWGDSFRPGHAHSGLDIFGGTSQGQTAVVAAYDGYLTRLPDWKSSLIIRIPSDPLQPDRQIWTYYTHMADPQGVSLISADFPPGTYERFVRAGDFLGWQGNYSGNPNRPTGVHLHFSIVRDDGSGNFLNELEIDNTLDPSPYFQVNLDARRNQTEIPVCQER